MTEIDIFWRDYKFFPYEKKLALREIEMLLSPTEISVDNKKITVKTSTISNIDQLVYFSHASSDKQYIETKQNQVELKESRNSKRQNTRYSVHGIHEYKGKFNPQVVRSLFNIYGISKDSIIFDPFCGSGTTLVEAAHIGACGLGTDINPLAVFIANTKIHSLGKHWRKIEKDFQSIVDSFVEIRPIFNLPKEDSDRIFYLKKWFPIEILLDIECLRCLSVQFEENKNLILILISNLLRDYSYQEPKDLRIRRRKSPLPIVPLLEELKANMTAVLNSIKNFQDRFGIIESKNKAINIDINNCRPEDILNNSIDFAITSPPYATALPYIDTQRLSLVWLSMIESNEINKLESKLIGSREYKMKSEQDDWNLILVNNSKELPVEVHLFCMNLFEKLGVDDGFRKQAGPSLLYRYFFQMKCMFESVKLKLKQNAHFALIVGHNHTTIGGTRTDINTPELLIPLAMQLDFELSEHTALEAYHRYGLNSLNSVSKESLIVFKKNK